MAILSVAKIIARPGPIRQAKLLRHTFRSLRQAGEMPGCLEAIAVPDGRGVYFAISRWESEKALQNYVRAAAHGEAAKASRDLTRCHVSHHQAWDLPIPAWDAVAPILKKAFILDTKHVGDLTEEEKRAGPRRPYRNVLRAKTGN